MISLYILPDQRRVNLLVNHNKEGREGAFTTTILIMMIVMHTIMQHNVNLFGWDLNPKSSPATLESEPKL